MVKLPLPPPRAIASQLPTAEVPPSMVNAPYCPSAVDSQSSLVHIIVPEVIRKTPESEPELPI